MPSSIINAQRKLSRKLEALSKMLDQEGRQIMRLDMGLSRLMEQYSLPKESLTQFLAVLMVTDGLMETAQSRLVDMERILHTLKPADRQRLPDLMEQMEQTLELIQQADGRMQELYGLLEDMEQKAEKSAPPKNLHREPFWDMDPRFLVDPIQPRPVIMPAESHYVS